MHRHVYNACLLLGWLLTSVGAGLAWLPAGFIVGGTMLIGLTLVSAWLSTRSPA